MFIASSAGLIRGCAAHPCGAPFGRPAQHAARVACRTCDPLVRSQILYPTELQVRFGIRAKGSDVRFCVFFQGCAFSCIRWGSVNAKGRNCRAEILLGHGDDTCTLPPDRTFRELHGGGGVFRVAEQWAAVRGAVDRDEVHVEPLFFVRAEHLQALVDRHLRIAIAVQ